MASVGNSELGRVLQGTGVTSPPQYSTAAYPVTSGASGNILTSNGTDWLSAAPAPPPPSGILTITGNSGGALSGTNINLVTANSTLRFIGSGTTETLDFSITNLCLGTTLPALTTGVGNVSMGLTTQRSITTGNENTSVGYNAGELIADGTFNTCFGAEAGNGIVSGNFNTCIGKSAMGVSGAGVVYNTAVGYGALAGATGTENVAVGALCMSTLSSGGSNVGIGVECLQIVSSGGANTCIGRQAGKSITTQTYNTLIGYQTAVLATGEFNTVIGANAYTNAVSTGNDNVFVGYASGYYSTSATQNIGIGRNTCFTESGSNNICVGHAAGSALVTTEANNIIIGNVGVAADAGQIRIGTTATHTLCNIAGIFGSTVTGAAVLCDSNGNLGTVVSSIRYKENIEGVEDISLLGLTPVKFNYKSDAHKTKIYGLIAEEVEKQVPSLCLYDSEGRVDSVKYHELPALLLKEIQRLHERIKILENK